jgi:hypothetical protein
MELNTFDKITIVIVGLLTLSILAFGGAAVMLEDTTNETDTQPTPEPNQAQPPEEVNQSLDGAKALKTDLSGTQAFSNATVNINQNGEVLVYYQSEAGSGPALKEEMAQVAFHYSTVVGNHSEMGGLTVAANGVQLMVSKDAAIAHNEGRLQDDAYKQTFHWESYDERNSD